jgi:hypothetical protein
VDPISNWSASNCDVIWWSDHPENALVNGEDVIKVDGVNYHHGLTAQVKAIWRGQTNISAQIISKNSDGKWTKVGNPVPHLWTINQ